MSFSGFLVQLLNGLAAASSLFFVAAGLSLIFGVTRIVNFAHGSFFMAGIYIAYSVVERFAGSIGFWPSLAVAALAVGVLGALIEMLLLRRIYKAPELFQLLATFALVLVLKDAVLWLWGPEELLGPRAPGLAGSVSILGRQFPMYDLFLIVAGPVVLALLWLLLTRTRFGTLVRAATQDREMVSALGVNQAWLFTTVFALGALLAGLGGALQLPREPANLEMDLNIIGAAFVVVVVGGMGSIPGAYLAALLIAEVKAVCIWLGVVDVFGVSVSFSKLTLVVDFLVMAVVLVWRPWGLLGRPQAPSRYVGMREEPLRPASKAYLVAASIFGLLMVAMPLLTASSPYTTVLLIDLLIAALFAASLHFIMGPAGMHSFGHAAYFGLGAYGAALLVRALGLPMEVALLQGAVERVVPSEYVAEFFRAAFPGLSLRVIPHGVDFLALMGAGQGHASTDDRQEPDAPITLGYLGSIVLQKGLHVLLQALQRVPSSRLRLRVAGGFYGDPVHQQEIRNLIAADTRVEWLGQVQPGEVAAVLGGIDLLCLPSIVPESFSLVLHEAAALGVPSLVSDLGAPRAKIEAHGGGRSVAAGDVNAWAQALTEIVEAPDTLGSWRSGMRLPYRVEEEAFFYESLYRQAVVLD
eukprot:gene25529-31999_t